jgi:glycosyltransferase involved in cell wall biosynthesis
MITNHGCHSPVIELTTDTGGQNFYVNALSEAFVRQGYKVTILNRGGYKHPVTKQMQRGIVYYDDIWPSYGKFCRLIYLEDSQKRFITKERLTLKNLEEEAAFFFRTCRKIGASLKDIYLISSHYWDAGILGMLINKGLKKRKVAHVWTTHSLGRFKKDKFKNAPEPVLKKLHFQERFAFEEDVLSTVDGVIATSNKMRDYLSRYRAQIKNHFWLPPGIDVREIRPRTMKECGAALGVLEEYTKMSRKDVRNMLSQNVVFLEISRTAKAKQKDMVMKAFARMANKDKALLIMNIDPSTDIYKEVMEAYRKTKKKDRIILIDRFLERDEAVQLFSLANVFITPSLSDPWGMSAQEAAASRCAVISSKHVAFAVEILKDNCLQVHKHYSRLYAEKMDILINEPHLRQRLASNAYKLVAKHYSWTALAEQLIVDMKKRKLVR